MSHLPARSFPGLRKQLERHSSLYDALAKAYGVQPAEGEETIETVLAGPHDARLLGVDVGLPLLLLSRHAFDMKETRSNGHSRGIAATGTSSSPGCGACLQAQLSQALSGTAGTAGTAGSAGTAGRGHGGQAGTAGSGGHGGHARRQRARRASGHGGQRGSGGGSAGTAGSAGGCRARLRARQWR